MKLFVIICITFFTLYGVEAIVPIPQNIKYDTKKALLGKKLFSDTDLSKDKKISCASCHNLSTSGADSRVVSVGVYGRKGNVQAPTVFNAYLSFRQFWNGRAKDLSNQAHGPISTHVEMSMTKKDILDVVEKKYKKEFFDIYKTKNIKFTQVIDAIVEFEKALTTPNSKFDKYLRGEVKLSKEEYKGYTLFKEFGCITCHNGVNIGANSFQKMGLFVEYNNIHEYPDRAYLTKDANDKNVFKVPTLRNISKTAPYFHDGSRATLGEAIKVMSYHNLGFKIDDKDVQTLIAFLKTLDAPLPKILRVK